MAAACDARQRWIGDQAADLLGVHMDLWNALVGDPTTAKTLEDFLNEGPSGSTLAVALAASDSKADLDQSPPTSSPAVAASGHASAHPRELMLLEVEPQGGDIAQRVHSSTLVLCICKTRPGAVPKPSGDALDEQVMHSWMQLSTAHAERYLVDMHNLLDGMILPLLHHTRTPQEYVVNDFLAEMLQSPSSPDPGARGGPAVRVKQEARHAAGGTANSAETLSPWLLDESFSLASTFDRLLSQSITRLFGAVQLRLPTIPHETLKRADQTDSEKRKAIEFVTSSVQEWSQLMVDTMEAESRKRSDGPLPMAELEYWRNRSSTLSGWYERMSLPGLLSYVDWLAEVTGNSNAVEVFRTAVTKLEALHQEAQENIKFLNTLERHFKNLKSGPVEMIPEALLSLLEAMRLIWIISRHYNTDERRQGLMIRIANQIAERVQSSISVAMVLRPDVKRSQDALRVAKAALESWEASYMDVRRKIENSDGDRRWEFDRRELFLRTQYMIPVCDNLLEVATATSHFRNCLGSELREVTKDPRTIHELRKKLQGLLESFSVLAGYEFDREFSETWSHLMAAFDEGVQNLEKDAIDFLDRRFRTLRSAVGAFNLLRKFQNIQTRPKINARMNEKFIDIIKQFACEIQAAEEMFEKRKDNPPVSRCWPAIGGSVCWSRSLLQKVKQPMILFHSMPSLTATQEGQEVTGQYLNFGRKLIAWEQLLVEEWKVNSADIVASALKRPILGAESDGTLKVNFAPGLWRLMRETATIDALGGYQLSATVLNLTLQREKYVTEVERLQKLLDDYHVACHEMPTIERKLVAHHLQRVERSFSPGMMSVNWSSLGIGDFVAACRQEINAFREVRDQLMKNVDSVESLIRAVQTAEIVPSLRKPDSAVGASPNVILPMDIQQFCEFFERHRVLVLEELGKQLSSLTPLVIKIEEITAGTKTGGSPKLAEYYDYWERRMYNAITVMLVRGLARFQTLFNPEGQVGVSRTRAELSRGCPPLLLIRVEFAPPDVALQGPIQTTFKLIGRLLQNLIQSACAFRRWMHGTCIEVPPITGVEDKAVASTIFSYFTEISHNPTLIDMTIKTHHMVQRVFQHVTKYLGSWKKYSSGGWGLWDAKRRQHLDKLLDKRPATAYFDTYMQHYQQLAQDVSALPPFKDIGFIRIDSTAVIEGIRRVASEWVAAYGRRLGFLAHRELIDIQTEVSTLRRGVNGKGSGFSAMCARLRALRRLHTSRLTLELRAAALAEDIRTLHLHGCRPDPPTLYEEASKLPQQWLATRHAAATAQMELQKESASFAEQTISIITEFEFLCGDFRSAFYESEACRITSGSLNVGLRVLRKFQTAVQALERHRMKLAPAQQLLGLPLRHYLELAQFTKDVERGSHIYQVHVDCNKIVEKAMHQDIKKMNASEVNRSLEALEDRLRRLGGTTDKFQFIEVVKTIMGSLTYLRRVVSLAGDLGAVSLKPKHILLLRGLNSPQVYRGSGPAARLVPAALETISLTLDHMIAARLDKYPKAVTDILFEAQEEDKLDQTLASIEQTWKSLSFEFSTFHPGGANASTSALSSPRQPRGGAEGPQVQGDSTAPGTSIVLGEGPPDAISGAAFTYVFRSNEELKNVLDDHLLQLQGILASRFATGIIENIRKCERNLQLISETFELWMHVQVKWMYLASIFSDSADLRHQLPQEYRRFDKLSRSFKSLMKDTSMNRSIALAACSVPGRQEELKRLASELDAFQKSLCNYIEGKRAVFPRFYFISDEELLSILGSSDAHTVPHQLFQTFANCRDLRLAGRLQISGMESQEGEFLPFHSFVASMGPVESWMKDVESAMKSSVAERLKKGVYDYPQQERATWIKSQLGMVTVTASKIWATWDIEDALGRMAKGEVQAMRKHDEEQSQQLEELTRMLQKIGEEMWQKVTTLIIIQVHMRDIVKRLLRDAVTNVNSFEWASQLRFYWDKRLDTALLKQCNATFRFGNEYLGLSPRLVVTPLTERCILTLTTAASFYLGGAALGPAGTGKTETVKDLAKAMAISCVVVNCGEGLDYRGIGRLLSGLVCTGFWGCFDEFNRINPEVLSVVSIEIQSIQSSLRHQRQTVDILGSKLPLVDAVGIFVTMNPAYGGRSELPDNLKALFRPVTMIVPDSSMICEIELMAQGFSTAQSHARKITRIYELAKTQLSKQHHYDFSLRALKAVLVIAGTLRRSYSQNNSVSVEDESSKNIQAVPQLLGMETENTILLEALQATNIPKLIPEDVPIFSNLLADFFPGVSLDGTEGSFTEMRQAVEKVG
eukprot:GHVT01001786.1.p1 GENE.GHVT01001786.1~~GHVT01001786.1.p1  ORF type:complete len:2279 (-),score=271.40 GHVT01001786.1:1123-7959(-)